MRVFVLIVSLSVFMLSIVLLFLYPINTYSLEKKSSVIYLNDGWMFRKGDCPKNDKGIPLWISEKDSPEWEKTNINDTSKMVNMNGSITKTTTMWFKVKLPSSRIENPAIYFEKILGPKIEVYIDAEKVHEINRTSWTIINKQIIPLDQNYTGKTLYIKVVTPELYKYCIGPKNQVCVGDFYRLTPLYVKNGFKEICFGVIFILFSVVSVFTAIFLPREQRKSWIFLGLLMLNTGIMVMLNGIDISMFINNLSEFKKTFLEDAFILLFEAVRFTFTNLLICFFIQIFNSTHKLRFIKKMLKVQNIYSIFCFLLLGIFILTGYKITTVYIICTYLILALLYFFEFIVLLITTISYVYKKDINAKILLFGFSSFVITFVIFFIIVASYSVTYSSVIWMTGTFIFIFSLITILGRNISADHLKVIEYSKTIEASKEQLNNLNKVLELRIKKRTKHLYDTLEQLKKAQKYLVESEKMAALGQLVASIAHEINTPIGAIQSSVNNISTHFTNSTKNLSILFENITLEQKNSFFDLIKSSINNEDILSSSEERNIKSNLISQLNKHSVNNAEEIADIFVDIGVYDNLELYAPILNTSNNSFIANTAYNMSGIKRNSRNIIIATEKISKLIYALKSYAYCDNEKQLIKVNVKTSIENVLVLYYNKSKYEVEIIKNYSDIPEILCNPDELTQVWANMIQNAFQAMNYKGKLEIRVFKKENTIVIQFIDDGTGIPDKIKDKIFLPFFTTKPQGEGTGLGLDIVKKIVERHGGNINFETIPGATTFNIILPIS